MCGSARPYMFVPKIIGQTSTPVLYLSESVPSSTRKPEQGEKRGAAPYTPP